VNGEQIILGDQYDGLPTHSLFGPIPVGISGAD
jgi:hypothetical protein